TRLQGDWSSDVCSSDLSALARATPRIARLSDSVAPDVNTISSAAAPRSEATCARAVAMRAAATAPRACAEEGLAKSPPAVRQPLMAAATAGSTGVVAA